MRSGFFSKQKSVRIYETFQDLIAYLEPGEIEKLKLDTYPTEGLDSIVEIIRGCKWQQAAHTTHFPVYALLAFKEGKINGMEFSTSQMFYGVYKHPDNKDQIKQVNIFNEKGELAPNAEKMIDATMKLCSASARAFAHRQIDKLLKAADEIKAGVQKNSFKLTESPLFSSFFSRLDKELADKINSLSTQEQLKIYDGIIKYYESLVKRIESLEGQLDWIINETKNEKSEFYQILKSLPASEQCFLLVPDHDFDAETTVTREINFRLNVNVLSRLMVNGKPMIMIPSKGMMQAYLEATRGKNAPRLVSRFGLSPWRGLLNEMKHGIRDLFVAFEPLAHLSPLVADNFLAPSRSADTEKHDGTYHGMRFADVPSVVVKLFAEIAEPLLPSELEEATPDVSIDFRSALATTIIDMEMVAYDRKYTRKAYVKILNDFKKAATPDAILARMFRSWETEAEEAMLEGHNPFWVSMALVIRLAQLKTIEHHHSDEWRSKIISVLNILCDEMIKNENEWHATYQFSLSSLISYLHDSGQHLANFNEGLIIMADYIQKKSRELTDNKTLQQLDAVINSDECLFFRQEAKRKLTANVQENVLEAVTVCLRTQSKPLATIVHDVIRKDIQNYTVVNGTLEKMLVADPELIRTFLRTLTGSPVYDELIQKSIANKNNVLFHELFDATKINTVFCDGNTMLQTATLTGNYQLMRFLLAKGADPALAGKTGKIPIAIAALTGRLELTAIVHCTTKFGKDWETKRPDLAEKIDGLYHFALRPSLSRDEQQKYMKLKVWFYDFMKDVSYFEIDDHYKQVMGAMMHYREMSKRESGIELTSEWMQCILPLSLWAGKMDSGIMPDVATPTKPLRPANV